MVWHGLWRLGVLRVLVGLGFLIWVAIFIERSALRVPDGGMYFCLFDDAMISMRYAWNLAHGHGLVWNPGERIEGISNLLWTLIMAVPCWMFDKSTAVLAVQILGVAILFSIAMCHDRIAGRLLIGTPLEQKTWPRVAAFAIPLAYYPLVYWTCMGMETGWLALLFAASVLLALTVEDSPRVGWRSCCLLGLALMTRPDALWPALVFLAYRAVTRREREASWRSVAFEIALVGAFGVAVCAFRQFYYGSFVPNTYLLKMTGLPVVDRLADGVRFTGGFLVTVAPLLAIALIGFLSFPTRALCLLVGMFVASLATQIYVGGDAWTYWRMPAPFLPFLAVPFLLGADRVAAWVVTLFASHRRGGATVAAGLLAFSALAWSNRQFIGEVLFVRKGFTVEANHINMQTARALTDLLQTDAAVGVFWAGALPYYVANPAVDFLGKSDPYIARLNRDRDRSGHVRKPGHDKYDLEYSILELRPTYLQGMVWRDADVRSSAAEHYQIVQYGETRLVLLKGSPHVDWTRIRPTPIRTTQETPPGMR